MGLKDVIKPRVFIVISAVVRVRTGWDPKRSCFVFQTGPRFARQVDISRYDSCSDKTVTRWEWSDFERATGFKTEKEARVKLRYLTKKYKDDEDTKDFRIVKVTLHPQIEQIYPTPGIVDAIGSLALDVALEGV